ncbi:hypothetical protein TCAL_08015 [Tigriopus californicus]|uniref:Ubiquitin carboxyl-terminal hydrolase MINDY n=1 Tax=Tigriopus californicus TaxID=6832 RepID=A0A553PIE2_TIGCA|nr:probable ubiquitin carboxyl-terminal hydrolase MINDY-4 [Tigriopus californicus]TRY77449.1 hypothetical protein TCAL_08015 [Tigriopus californicus]|eukprot:TCALIF_08015-PA protein Name:"Similar to Fam188b Protein FAM188B (Mus musculus)" AED:0.22 eAED:0.23 QI:0/-1/0/1/-1/1/1/0/755
MFGHGLPPPNTKTTNNNNPARLSRRNLNTASRRRQSIGQSVDQVVEHHLALRSKSREDAISPVSTSSSHSHQSGYYPSFGTQTSQSIPSELTDVNEALELRLKMNSNRRRSGGFMIPDLGPAPQPKNVAPKLKNSLIQIGTIPPQSSSQGTLVQSSGQKMNRSQSLFPQSGTVAPNLAEWPQERRRGVHPLTFTTQDQTQPSATMVGRKISLGLSYGPITSSVDDEALSRRPRIPNSRKAQLGDPLPKSPRHMHGALNGSIEKSWRQQVDAATARVTARSNSRSNHNQYPTESQHQHARALADQPNYERKLSAAAPANTLTLDNWFTQDPLSPVESTDSSRRNSGLAPIPDVEDYMIPKDSVAAMELRDLDEQEQDFSISPPVNHNGKQKLIIQRQGQPFTLELATSLRMLLFGTTNRSFPSGWWNQAFEFDGKLKFGFRQIRGGPCGVLASVQAILLQALLFGSQLDDTTRAVDPLAPNKRERENAFVVAIASILAKCAQKTKSMVLVMPSSRTHFTGIGRYKDDAVTETFSRYEFTKVKDVIRCLEENVTFFTAPGNHGVVAFLYSVMLTRGFANIRDDMDSPDLPLMAAHGYCSQEMVNLFLVGEAISNSFDGTVTLGGENGSSEFTKLRGIDHRSDIGMLSLFEHYQSIRVGENFKTPNYPIWLICSESHFSVLFATVQGVQNTNVADRQSIQVIFYDGLAMQEELVNLTIDCSKSELVNDDQDLVPPLEYCIRTKWRDAYVNWNGHQKIL